MPIMVPIDVKNVPAIPVFDMTEYLNCLSKYATELWNAMACKERAKFSRRSNQTSDAELAALLENCPSYDSVAHDDMSQLTKDDYVRFVNTKHTMKGIGKWL